MRVLFTSFTFAPQRNGVSEVVSQQAFGLARLGHEVSVVTTEVPGRPSRMGDVSVYPFALSDIDQNPTELARYQQFIARFDADVIISHCWRSWATDCAIPGIRRSRASKMLFSHGFSAHRWERERKFPWGLGVWLRGLPYLKTAFRVLQSYNRIAFLSDRSDFDRFFDRTVVNRLGWPRVSVIPNAANPEFAQLRAGEFRKRYGIGEQFLVLMVASYAPTKNQELLLEGFVHGRIAGCLVFIGQIFTAYTNHLRQLALNCAADQQILFIEDTVPGLVRDAYADADVIALSSRGETQPLVLLDALAAGKPFISTPVGCVPDLPGGILASSVAEWATGLNRLAADSQFRAELGKSGAHAYKTTYNWQTVIRRLERELQDMTQSPAEPSQSHLQ